MNARVLVLVAALLALALPAVASADFTMPNDFNGSDQWNFTGPADGLPSFAPLARDPDNSSGIDFTGAWRLGNVGRPDILIAYIEGGANYDSDGIKDAPDNILLHQGDVALPDRT